MRSITGCEVTVFYTLTVNDRQPKADFDSQFLSRFIFRIAVYVYLGSTTYKR